MKKLLLTLDYPPNKGGVAVYLKYLADQFDPADIIVLAQPHPESRTFDSLQDYTVLRSELLYRKIWPRWIKAYFAAKNAMASNNVGYLLISHILPMGYIALMINKPFAVVVHGMDLMGAKRSGWKSYWAKKVLSKAELIIANSEFTKNEAVSLGAKAGKIEVARPCPKNLLAIHFDHSRWEKLHSMYQPQDQKILLSVNRLVSRKGIDSVIKAMPEILKKFPNTKYLIVGNGPYQQELERLIDELHLQDSVKIINNAADADLPYYYRMASLFLLTSRIENGFDVEGFGIVFLEAALYRVPAIGTFSGGIPEAVADNETGILVQENDPASIARAVINLLANDQVRHKLGDRAKARVIEEFTWEKQFSKVKTILK